jgi:hypothetical protein
MIVAISNWCTGCLISCLGEVKGIPGHSGILCDEVAVLKFMTKFVAT